MKNLMKVLFALVAISMVLFMVSCANAAGGGSGGSGSGGDTSNPGVTELEKMRAVKFADLSDDNKASIATALETAGITGTWEKVGSDYTFTVKEAGLPAGQTLDTIVALVASTAATAVPGVTPPVDATPGKILIIYENGSKPTAAEIDEVIESFFGPTGLPAGFTKENNTITIESDAVVASLSHASYNSIVSLLTHIKTNAATLGAESATLEGKNLTVKIANPVVTPPPVDPPSGNFYVEVVNAGVPLTEAELTTDMGGQTVKEAVESIVAPGGTWNAHVYTFTAAEILAFAASTGAPAGITVEDIVDMLVTPNPDGDPNPFSKKSADTLVLDVSVSGGSGGGTPPGPGNNVNVAGIKYVGTDVSFLTEANAVQGIAAVLGGTAPEGTWSDADKTYTFTAAMPLPSSMVNDASMGFSYDSTTSMVTVNLDVFGDGGTPPSGDTVSVEKIDITATGVPADATLEAVISMIEAMLYTSGQTGTYDTETKIYTCNPAIDYVFDSTIESYDAASKTLTILP